MDNRFITSEDIIQEWKYDVTELSILYRDKSYNVPPERVTGFNIDNDYENNLFPIIKVNMTIDPDVYSDILKDKKNIMVKIRIQKFYTTKEDENNKSLLRDYINDTFYLIMDEEDLSPDKGIRKEDTMKDNNLSDRLDSVSIGGTNEFYLYKQDTLIAMKNTINDVLTNVTMIGAVSYITAKCGVKQILASPFENNKSYEELLIPPQTALSAIQYIDSEYGFYKYGSMIFFGAECAYILNYKGGCTAWLQDEIKETSFLIPVKGGDNDGLSAAIIKKGQEDKRNYIICNVSNMEISDKTITNDMIGGNNATIINTNTKTVTDANISKDGHNQIIKTNTSNEWLATTYAAQSAANSVVISLGCSDFDISAITPNKKFNFLFEDTALTEKYKGDYMITRSSLIFTKNGATMTISANLTFKRCGITTTVDVKDNS